MRVLVTGANGFVGQHLCETLRDFGYEVFRHGRCCGDLSEKGALDNFPCVDYVFHLAAQTYVPDSWQLSTDYMRSNVIGTEIVLEYCRKHQCGVTLMSTYVYGEPKYIPVDEVHPVIAMTPYHQSKLMCESLGEFYSRTFQIPVTVFRPFNIYGFGQNRNFLIPSIMQQLLDSSTNKIEVMDLSPRRDYIYVEDVVDALIRAMRSKLKGFEIFNLGSGISLSVEEVIQTIINVSGIHKEYIAKGEQRQAEILNCVADTSKIEAKLGMTELTPFHIGIKKIFKCSSIKETH